MVSCDGNSEFYVMNADGDNQAHLINNPAGDASMDPVGELLDAILEAKQISKKRGGNLTVVASVCGTEGDPQDLNLQIQLLRDAGVIVFQSNATAASFCCALLK
jgi:FdrA protein